MALIIRNRQIVEDDWNSLPDDAPLRAGDQVIVSLQRWQTERAALQNGVLSVGVRLPNTASIDEVWPLIADRPLIALEFPAFSDGRAYSQARLLRRAGYRGQLRAVGDVMRDEVREMYRCGFDTLVPRPDQDLDDCLAAFNDFSLSYQGAADAQPTVAQRRRHA